jgi:hypothetical protein
MKLINLKILHWALIVMGIYSFQEIMSQDNTLYFMTGIPQVTNLNPATQPAPKFYIGLVSLHENFSNNAITYNDVYFNTKDDSLTDFIHTTAATDKFLSKFDNMNYMSSVTGEDILGFGFRSNRMYFSVNFSIHEDARITFPKDLVSFLTLHLPPGVSYDLSKFNMNLIQYSEIGLGISRRFGDQITVGIRPKVLFGIGNISTNTHSFSITGDPVTQNLVFSINSDVNVCAPGYLIPVDSKGFVDLNGDFKFNDNIKSTNDYINLFTQNWGMGIDAGFNYKPFDRLELSASVIDFGYINWNHYSHKYNVAGTYTYQGPMYDSKDSSFKSPDILDSLKSNFKFSGSDGSFTTNLTPKLFVGGHFFVFPKLDFGALGRFDFYKDNYQSNIILSANFRPIELWNVSVSYSLLDKSYSTFGLGMSIRVGFFNFYIASDDVPTTYTMVTDKNNNRIPSPNDIYSDNLKVGVNIVFGSGMKKKLKEDEPMYISSEY